MNKVIPLQLPLRGLLGGTPVLCNKLAKSWGQVGPSLLVSLANATWMPAADHRSTQSAPLHTRAVCYLELTRPLHSKSFELTKSSRG